MKMELKNIPLTINRDELKRYQSMKDEKKIEIGEQSGFYCD